MAVAATHLAWSLGGGILEARAAAFDEAFVQGCRWAFSAIDQDGSGTVSRWEARQWDATRWSAVDEDGSGEIEFAEWLRVCKMLVWALVLLVLLVAGAELWKEIARLPAEQTVEEADDERQLFDVNPLAAPWLPTAQTVEEADTTRDSSST